MANCNIGVISRTLTLSLQCNKIWQKLASDNIIATVSVLLLTDIIISTESPSNQSQFPDLCKINLIMEKLDLKGFFAMVLSLTITLFWLK